VTKINCTKATQSADLLTRAAIDMRYVAGNLSSWADEMLVPAGRHQMAHQQTSQLYRQIAGDPPGDVIDHGGSGTRVWNLKISQFIPAKPPRVRQRICSRER
jgi:hypothetical protein